MQRLFVCLEELLAGRKADVLRGLSLAVLSIIITGTEVISQNGFMECVLVMLSDCWSSFLSIVSSCVVMICITWLAPSL